MSIIPILGWSVLQPFFAQATQYRPPSSPPRRDTFRPVGYREHAAPAKPASASTPRTGRGEAYPYGWADVRKLWE